MSTLDTLLELNDFQYETLKHMADSKLLVFAFTDPVEVDDMEQLVDFCLVQEALEAVPTEDKGVIHTYALTEVGLRLFTDLDSRAVN